MLIIDPEPQNDLNRESNIVTQQDINYVDSNKIHNGMTSAGSKWQLSSDYWRNDGIDPETTQLYFPCKDRVNYDVLKGHRYEIVENPERGSVKNSRLYICKYDNCGKTFTKTWNLVDHFRIHTKEKPFICEGCNKKFSQKCNLKRHIKLNSCHH